MNNRCGIVQELRYVLIIIRSLIGKMRFESRGWNMVQMLRRPGVLSGQQICKNSHVCHVQIIRSFLYHQKNPWIGVKRRRRVAMRQVHQVVDGTPPWLISHPLDS